MRRRPEWPMPRQRWPAGGWRRGRGRDRRYSGSRQGNTRRVECRQSDPTAAALMLASLRAAGSRDLAFGVLLVAPITRGCCRVLQARGAASTCGAMQRDHVRRPAGVSRRASTAFTRCRDFATLEIARARGSIECGQAGGAVAPAHRDRTQPALKAHPQHGHATADGGLGDQRRADRKSARRCAFS